MCVPVRGHRGELGDRRSRRVDLEASRDAAGPERLPGSREAVRRASSRSDNSLTEQSASDRSPAHAGPSTARGRPRSEASFEKVIRTSTLSTTAASHRTQRGGRESNSSWRGRDPPKTSQLELVTAGQRERRRREPRKRAHTTLLAVAASFLLSRRHLCDVARSWYQHGGRVHRPRQGRQAQRRRRLRVHGRLAVPGRLEAGPQERPRHALVCQRCAAPPPQFRRRRRRLTSPRAAPQATNSRASGRMGGCTGSACTPGKLATSTSAR